MIDFSRLIFDKARSNGMPVDLANFIVGQAAHESANFTSPVFKDCKNFFGYKYRGQKIAAGSCRKSPEGDYYAFYSTLEDSITEITDWIKRRQAEGRFPQDLTSIRTAERYAQLLKDSDYYGDPVSVYATGIRKFASNYGALIGFSGILFIAAISFFLLRSKRTG